MHANTPLPTLCVHFTMFPACFVAAALRVPAQSQLNTINFLSPFAALKKQQQACRQQKLIEAPGMHGRLSI